MQEEKKTLNDMMQKAESTASLLKTIANPLRLVVLCSLAEGEKNVTTLTNITGVSQTLMSNHLAILRKANIVDFHRDHRTLNYYLKDLRMKELIFTLYALYCAEP